MIEYDGTDNFLKVKLIVRNHEKFVLLKMTTIFT